MQTANSEQLYFQLRCPRLPLAVYREVAAHLCQVEGVKTGLNPPQGSDCDPSQARSFDYIRSQIGSLWIQYPENVSSTSRQQVDRILNYYGDRYGSWTVHSNQ